MHKNWFSVCSFLLVTGLILSVSIYMLVKSVNEPDIFKIKCNETNCTVNVQNGECYAKMEQACLQDFKKVKCDVTRQYDVNNITLPCNILSGERIIINCDIKNTDKSSNIAVSIMLMVLGGMLLLMTVAFGYTIYHLHGFLDETPQEDSNPAPNNDSNEMHEEVNEEMHEKSHEKNTGSNYTRFDKA